MGLYELVLQGEYQGQATVNRFTYLSSGTPAAVSGSFGLISSLGFIKDLANGLWPVNTLFEKIRACAVGQVRFVSVAARRLYSQTDFYETPFPNGTVGTLADTASPPTVALGFRTNRTRLDVARGTKRFVGMPTVWQGEGGHLTAQALIAAQTLADYMTAVATYNDEGNTLTYSPVVLGREEYTVQASGKKAYRYYADEATQLQHTAESVIWEAYNTTRTQNSRQYGKGS